MIPNNPQAFLNSYQTFMQNPGQIMARMGIPQEMTKSPDDAIQHLLNTGRINQQQYMQARQMARQLQNMQGIH